MYTLIDYLSLHSVLTALAPFLLPLESTYCFLHQPHSNHFQIQWELCNMYMRTAIFKMLTQCKGYVT